MNAVIRNARGVRAAWGELFDALTLGVHVLAPTGVLSVPDWALLVAAVLKTWPDNNAVTMVDRLEAVEKTAARFPNEALRLFADRDLRTQLVSSLLRPVECVMSVRQLSERELERLAGAIRVAGEDPARFALGGGVLA
jgi:hypothetical protein